MKQILIAFFAMFALQSSASVMVYDEVDMPFANYAGYLKESFDINVTLPHGFTDKGRMCEYHPVTASGETGINTLVGAMLQSADSNCAVLMSDMWWRGQDLWQGDTGYASEFMKCQVYWALKDEFYYVYLDQNPPIDLSKYVTKVKAAQFNADTAFVSTLPTTDSVMGQRYTHRTHLVMSKAGRPIVEVNILFTDKGEKDKKKYLKSVFEAIKFGNNSNWQFNNDRDWALRKQYIGKYHDYISQFIR